MNILLLAMVALGTWGLVYEYYYSPKARIKKLYREISKLKLLSPSDSLIVLTEANKKGKMINALIDYYFDPVEDKEYIENKKYPDSAIEQEEWAREEERKINLKKD